MSDYRLTASSTVIRMIDGASIPNDPDNRDWAVYQAWLAEGNAPDPYVPPAAPVPTTVSRMQAMVALQNAELLQPVQSWVVSQDATTQLIWQNAAEFLRDSSLLARAASALNLSDQQVDQLFASAAQVNP